jgi:UDP-3-O-[3-hydroxymyristoyl] glucosamine N-acyltransferase
MKISPRKLKDIAEILGCGYAGNADHIVSGFNEIHRAGAGDCIFVDHPKYYDKALSSPAGTVLINKRMDPPPGKGLLFHDDPFHAFNRLTRHYKSIAAEGQNEKAVTGKNTVVMPGCYLGKNVRIGDNCVLHPNVTIYDDTVIGDHVVIHANTAIGSDAFYFKKRSSQYEALYSCGNVIIQDQVFIGSNCSVARGVTDSTVIGRGTIIDNHVHIGHDVILGEMCLLAAQVGIAGACTIGSRVTMWGQVGVSSGISIGDGATILAQSGVGENVNAGETWFGTPAYEARDKMKEIFAARQLPGLIGKLYGKKSGDESEKP